METEESIQLVTVRLSERADRMLRNRVQRKGDISRLIGDAIRAADFQKVHVIPRKRQAGVPRQKFATTSVKFEKTVYRDLSGHAEKRGVTASAFLDAIIIEHYSEIEAR